jgi:hypothetical protein
MNILTDNNSFYNYSLNLFLLYCSQSGSFRSFNPSFINVFENEFLLYIVYTIIGIKIVSG